MDMSKEEEFLKALQKIRPDILKEDVYGKHNTKSDHVECAPVQEIDTPEFDRLNDGDVMNDFIPHHYWKGK